jgi:hypothetical protein
MKRPSSANLSRAEKVLAIQKAVREGSYEIDSAKVAKILVMHLLNQPTRRQSSVANSRQLMPTLCYPSNAGLAREGERLH